MGVEKMSGIYIPGAKIPDGDYVRVLMLHKDGTCIDGIGNVFKVIPVPPHGRLGDLDRMAEKIEGIWDCNDLYFQPNDNICDPEDCKGCKWRETWDCFHRMVKHTPTIIPAEEG